MGIKIKVCGMRERDNIIEVSRIRPDYMGFIFYPGTPRYVGESFRIPAELPASTRRVGVFVNETTDVIMDKADAFGLDIVQLHGSESVAQCQELKSHGISVIKVFSVDENMDFDATNPYVEHVDYFLFDTKGKFYGGNARAFDWSILRRYSQAVPFFLSGGIAVENAARIHELGDLNLLAVDLNSGVELRPALKDIAKIEAIRAILNSNKQ